MKHLNTIVAATLSVAVGAGVVWYVSSMMKKKKAIEDQPDPEPPIEDPDTGIVYIDIFKLNGQPVSGSLAIDKVNKKATLNLDPFTITLAESAHVTSLPIPSQYRPALSTVLLKKLMNQGFTLSAKDTSSGSIVVRIVDGALKFVWSPNNRDGSPNTTSFRMIPAGTFSIHEPITKSWTFV